MSDSRPVDPGPDLPAAVPALTTSDRGLNYAPVVPSRDGGGIEVHTSSLAFRGPHIRITATAPADFNQPDGPSVEAALHLSAVDGLRFAGHIAAVVAAHYQLGAEMRRTAELAQEAMRSLAELAAIARQYTPTTEDDDGAGP